MTRAKRVAAQLSVVVLLIGGMSIGGVAATEIGDRLLGLTANIPREVIAPRRDEFPFFGYIAIVIAGGTAFLALSAWPWLARKAGLSNDEIREIMRKPPSVPDA